MLEFYGRKFTCDECPICEGIEHMSIAHKSSVFPLRLKRLLSTAKKTHWWSRRIAESVRTTKTSSQATSCSASITKNMCRSIRGGGFMTSTPMKGFLGLP